jgi:putative hydroxymethylpyrimidine transport system permease protein
MRGILITLSFLVLWQLFVLMTRLPNYILPSPILVLQTLIQQFPLIISQSIPTIIETILGLLGAIILGCLTALSMAYIQTLKYWLRPILLISQALPTFAIAPLFVIWLGYGMISKIAITILILFFPIASSFFDGLSHTKSSWLDLAKIMGASKLRTLIYIRVPAAIPNLITGLKVATAGAPMGAVIGEWVGASKGLGFLILNANARMQIDLMFAALFILILWSIILYFSIDFILNRYLNWQHNFKKEKE